MTRSWTTILLVGGLTALLVLLGALQYRWMSQISEADGEKAKKRVQEQADRFASEFNREIQNAYFNFQTDADTWKSKDWKEFNERYDFWLEKTAYGTLIKDFYFFEGKSASPLRYDRATKSFIPAEPTAELVDLQTQFSDDKNFRPVYAESHTLVVPIHSMQGKDERILIRTRTPDGPTAMHLPEKFGYLAIQLDPATIRERLLPDLTQKHFGDGEFRVAVDDKLGNAIFQSITGAATDASAPLFDLSPDNFVFFANKDLMKSVGGEKRDAIVMNQRIETHSETRTSAEPKDGTVKFELKKDAMPRTKVFTTTTRTGGESPWTLQVQHSSGSLDAFIASTLRRNLMAGFGILFLLAAAIAAIIISAQRAKMLARRQIDFVSSVSHEFRTPLAVIYSAGENLADGVAKEDGQVVRYGDLIKGEGRKLTGMVEQILDFAGANSGRKKYTFSRAEVSEVVGDALAECSSLLKEKGIEVEADISPSLPTIEADRVALSGAIQNLIINSVKYGNGNNWLRVTAENGGGKVKISVEDRGIGISRGDLSKVFEPFYRSKDVVDAQIHGNGLGLSIVKQIAVAHGGRVFATSEVGKGSKFTIELKAEPPA